MENYHLTHEDGKYKLTKENGERASKVFESNKDEAIKSSKDFIQNQGGGSLKIHKNDGGFQEERTYPRANDPKKSKG
ncbi:DUF2188 domain-containing protein [Flavobacterium sp. DG1-102-2]|uniref:DUF2188 domain-containing protein n=1 Tax=Flavobacterium sp. DG1-102-2 TaxID=3081663 RepID=UPI002949FB7F|nr:DUF2188 domain-containing protein [Flavobacterium sp. DG1-102-2]MDV6169363.1 DUF2188 domain-containing protein [Flavobacterium sp. DG1-102-2]